MSNPWLKYCNPAIVDIKPYVPGKPESQLCRELNLNAGLISKLNSNESLWGPSPKITELFSAIPNTTYYPDGDAYELKQVIAKQCNLSPDCIALGNGSNELLDLIARAFLYAGASAVFSEYAFVVYSLSTQAQGAQSIVIPAIEYAHDLEQMIYVIDDSTRVVFIANPNNPTGTYIHADVLLELLKKVPKTTLIVLDQAYQEYIDDNADYSSWLNRFDNLIICRTFSKIHALAALRIGYSLSHPHITELINRIRPPFNTSALAQEAAIASLNDPFYIRSVAKQTNQAKIQLEQQLRKLNIHFIPSSANFLCCRLPQCRLTIEALSRKGIMVRPLENYGLEDYARITIGKPEQNKQLIGALADIISRQ